MKLVANKASYGFMGRLWSKGEEVEVLKGVKYPHEHFDIVEPKKEEAPKVEIKKTQPKVK